MARINVEDRLLVDERFKALVRSLGGDEDKAVGMCVRAWRLALKYWSDGEQLVPKKLWAIAGLQALVEFDLAAEEPGGIYCRGTRGSLSWLNELSETKSKAGKASAAARKAKDGTAIPHHASNAAARTAAEQTEQNPNTCSGCSAEHTEQPPNTAAEQTEQPPNTESTKPNALTPALALALDISSNVSQITSANPQAGRQLAVDKPPEDDSPVPEPAAYGEVVTLEGSRGTPKFSQRDMLLAQWLLGKVTAHAKIGLKLEFAQLEDWANELRLMQEVEEIPYNTLFAVLGNAFDDHRYAPYIESPSGARRRWGALEKAYNERRQGFDKNAGATAGGALT